MTKTEQLEELFKKWQEKQNQETQDSPTMLADAKIVKPNYFCKDGIVCEDKYNTEKTKVLFIANEPNTEHKSNIVDGKMPDAVTSQLDEFITYYNSHIDGWSGKLRQKICEDIFPAIVDRSVTSFPAYRGWENALRIAFMNLNKRGGKGSINNHLFYYCQHYRELIFSEIQIIDPDIIVWLGKTSFKMCFETIFKNTKKEKDRVFVSINGKTVPVVVTYHPSCGAIRKTHTHISDQLRGEFARKEAEKYKDYIRYTNYASE